MLRKPVPTGVVIGALSAQRVRRTLSITRVGQRRARAGHHVDAGLLHIPVDLHAGGVDAAASRLRPVRDRCRRR